MLHRVYLLLGSNVGDRLSHFEKALQKMNEQAGAVKKISSYYETEPWGVVDQGDYLNAAVYLETSLAPEELFERLNRIELEEGRTGKQKYLPRTLDIDILFYDDLVHHSETLSIPHPRLHLRRFVLVPLQEIAPGLVHPEFKMTVTELLDVCADDKTVKKL